MYFNWYCIPLIISSISTIVLAILVFKNKNFNGYKYFFLAIVSTSWYSFFYSLEISTIELNQAMFFYKLEFLAAPFLSLFFFLFTLVYSGWIRKVRPFLLLILAIIPIISLGLNWTNEYHGMYYLSPNIDTTGIYPFFSIQPNRWYFVQQFYEIILMILSFVILCIMWIHSRGTFRIQSSVLLFGLMIAFISFIITPLGLIPYGMDAVPYGLGINMILSYIGLNYFGLFDLVPQARALLLDQMKEGIVVIDRYNRIIDFNHSMVEIIPKISNSIGKKLKECMLDWEEIVDKILSNEVDLAFDFQKNSNQSSFWYHISVKSFTNDKKIKKQGRILTFRDITDLKEVEEKIKEQNSELLKLNKEKDKFFSILAHDLRSPLNGILGLTQIISNELDELNSDQIKDMVGGMRSASLHLYELLENLLEWGNMQNDSIQLEFEMNQLAELVDEAIYALALMIKNKSILIEYNLEPEIEIYVDSKMIASVFRNLISNAIKFSPRGSKIIISSELQNETIEISVQDFGIGIPSEYLDKLFLIHEKTNQLGTDGEPSTGIGLIITKDFVEKHNGRLKVQSLQNRGSKFTIELPRIRS